MGIHGIWRTSTYSAQEGECVEVAPLSHATGVRDSKVPARGHMNIPAAAWRDFVRTLKQAR